MLKQILDRAEKRRAKLGLTQAEVAERGGISKDVFRNIGDAIKKGKGHGVSTNTLQGLAVGLDVTVEWLFFGISIEGGNKPLQLDPNILTVVLAYRDLEVQREQEPMRVDDEVQFIVDKYNEILLNVSKDDLEDDEKIEKVIEDANSK